MKKGQAKVIVFNFKASADPRRQLIDETKHAGVIASSGLKFPDDDAQIHAIFRIDFKMPGFAVGALDEKIDCVFT